ncbi:MAG: type II secretion system F family protein [Thermoanaerobaculia bacterium]
MKGLTGRLPATAVHALADLVAAGFGAGQALAALPRQSLPPKVARRVEAELALLQDGGPLDAALDRLGLEITAASIRGSQARGADLEAALRADAEAGTAADGTMKKTRRRIGSAVVVLAGLTVSTLLLAFVVVPAQLQNLIPKNGDALPPGWQTPPVLLQFESFRRFWLTAGGAFLLSGSALATVFAGLLGKQRWSAFLQDLRLRLPFLREHAAQACRARLLEAMAFEQAAGLPADETLRRAARRERVPRLVAALELGAARLAAGEPWASCLRGTPLDTSVLADLNALVGQGAKPLQGLRWAAGQCREQAMQGLRRAITALAAVFLLPSFLYLLILLHAASVTAAVAQVESIRFEMESLTDEVDQILRSE